MNKKIEIDKFKTKYNSKPLRDHIRKMPYTRL